MEIIRQFIKTKPKTRSRIDEYPGRHPSSFRVIKHQSEEGYRPGFPKLSILELIFGLILMIFYILIIFNEPAFVNR